MHLLDRMNQQAVTWIKDVMDELSTEDPEQALRALRAGLQALRDRLSVEEAAQLGAQLPLIVRGMFFEAWDPTGKPVKVRHRRDFLDLVRSKYGPWQDLGAEEIVLAVFRVLEKHVSAGEIIDVLLSLPVEIGDVLTARVYDR